MTSGFIEEKTKSTHCESGDFWIDNTSGVITNPDLVVGNNTSTGTGFTSNFHLVDPSHPEFDCGDLKLKGMANNDINVDVINTTKSTNKNLIDNTYLGIINDTIKADGSTSDCHLYGQKRYVYEFFKKDTVLKNSNQQYVQFFDSATQGNLGKFSNIRNLLFLVTDSSQIHNDSSLIAYYLSTANSINQGITPQLIVETNKKAINEINVNKILKRQYNFNANEKQTIDGIAEQCPFMGGPAVIEARVIRRHWNDTVVYLPDIDLCYNNLPRNFASTQTSETNVISVYPNPAKDELVLKTATTGKIKITDITGRIIIERDISNTYTKISLKSITPSYYLLSFYANDGWSKSVRFAVAK